MNTAQWSIPSPVGTLFLVASENGLQGVSFDRQAAPMAKSLRTSDPAVVILAKAVGQLKAYFQGERKDFELPLDPSGTAFQKKVWNQLSQIPYGETASYIEVARRIRNPKASRAVGGANGKNPLCIIVPCHRVIAADGTLGGYTGGLSIKTKLLALERRG